MPLWARPTLLNCFMHVRSVACPTMILRSWLNVLSSVVITLDYSLLAFLDCQLVLYQIHNLLVGPLWEQDAGFWNMASFSQYTARRPESMGRMVYSSNQSLASMALPLSLRSSYLDSQFRRQLISLIDTQFSYSIYALFDSDPFDLDFDWNLTSFIQ